MKTQKNSNYLNKIIYYVPICLILKWIAMYKNIRNGIIISVLILFFVLKMLFDQKLKLKINNITTELVLAYALYNCITIVIAYARNYPLSLIFAEFANTILPIGFYFFAKKMNNELSYKFETVFLICCLIVFIVGMYYNLALTDEYYITFLAETNPNFSLHGFQIYPRLNAMFGSVICGVMGCIGICFSFKFLSKNNMYAFWTFLVICILLAIFTLQRSAMVCAIFNAGILLLCYMKNDKRVLTGTAILAIVMLLLLVLLSIKYPIMWNAIFERIGSIAKAHLERSEGWENAFENDILSTIFGYGFGTGGQRAISFSKATVNDGNYFKIIYETGIIGILLFLLIVFFTYYKKDKNMIYIIAFTSCLLQMIGSNILTFQLTASLFWYILGRMNVEDEKIIMQKSEDINEEKNNAGFWN